MTILTRSQAYLTSFVTTILFTVPAHAQSLSQFSSIATSAISVVQGLALLGCTAGFIRVGSMFAGGDDRAKDALKNTGIGTGVVAGATIIMQFIKGAF